MDVHLKKRIIFIIIITNYVPIYKIILHFLEKAMDENDALNLNNLNNYLIYMVSAWNLVIQLGIDINTFWV